MRAKYRERLLKSSTLLKAPHAEHYKKMGIEPIQYIEANNLPFHEGNIVKYITRWRDKEGVKDLEKVIWYAQRLIELEAKKNGK
jgi:hypothetical protein